MNLDQVTSNELGSKTLTQLRDIAKEIGIKSVSKYKKNELREVGIVEFMDSVQRLQVYESSTALLKGIYSGFVDASKIDKNELNFMREISLKN